MEPAERLHFSEVTLAEREKHVMANRYFPMWEISLATEGVNHITPLNDALKNMGWAEIHKRQPYIFHGQRVEDIGYERRSSYLILTIYHENQHAWTFVRIRGIGDDIIQLRNWMSEYESGYEKALRVNVVEGGGSVRSAAPK
jgi:hypothetical protein